MSLLVLACSFGGCAEPGSPVPGRLGRIRPFARLTVGWLEAILVTTALAMAALLVVRAIGIASRAAA